MAVIRQRFRRHPARMTCACIALGVLIALVFVATCFEHFGAWATDRIDLAIDRVGRWLNASSSNTKRK